MLACQQEGRKAEKIGESAALIRESIIEDGKNNDSRGDAGAGVCAALGEECAVGAEVEA